MHNIILMGIIVLVSAAAVIQGDTYILGINTHLVTLFFTSMLLARAIMLRCRDDD
ncbi:hypothetical protein [Nitratireductor aquibiodomus]|uniref:Uncharacterized protein n=1 Tax=Nitratireductor aquibiodomus TaxID=204799 RepID=A0A1H4Q6R7_9HYPH|nr:hypothetical protein [Nitratireductor aquibiodomus]SEC15299.1 hypothetical protein SAMN05216452_3957 [Nitratireductor aquibiodomus]